MRVSEQLLPIEQQYILDVPLALPVPNLLDLVQPIGRQNMMLNILQLCICTMRGSDSILFFFVFFVDNNWIQKHLNIWHWHLFDSIFYHSSEPRTERVALQLAPVESTDVLQSSDNSGTLNWKTEHDSKYTPIVFTQDFRYWEQNINAHILLSFIAPSTSEFYVQLLKLFLNIK